ncbi:MAG: N-acetyltransferase family protein [Pseudomonadota bacterium]
MATAFRAPLLDDAEAIRTITADGLASGHASFRQEPHDLSAFRSAFVAPPGISRVALCDDAVVGWVGVSPTSARSVYSGVGEISIYVRADQQGMGVGRALLEAAIDASESAGFWTLVAQIFPENEASLRLHAQGGFAQVGVRRALGKMPYGPLSGHWRDVIMLERRSDKVGLNLGPASRSGSCR